MNIRFTISLVLMLLSLSTSLYAANGSASQDETQTTVSTEYNDSYAHTLTTEQIYEIGLKAYQAADYPNAVLWFGKAVEDEDPKAQFYLGYCYLNGYGVENDNEKAATLFTKSSLKGIRAAQHNLGCLYFNGLGVEQDQAKAVELFRKSAEQGYADAQNNLGYCYDHGLGVEQDYEEALKWYRKAAAQGHKLANGNLKVLLEKMNE
ncbi:MAG: sel1 repeat family protein [Muribaculaceae bacterium]|nr:sel1 repeat family protein [Muribaculaceae bacterium]